MVDHTGHAVSFVTYLTVYCGNKFPPFYIGYTSIDKIAAGYHGSVRSKKYRDAWDAELRENPLLFKTVILSVHGTREEAAAKEIDLQRQLNVLDSPLYVNMAIGRHVDNRGRKHTAEHIAKFRAKRCGQVAWNKGKPNPVVAERNRARKGIKNPAHSAKLKGRKNPKHSERLKAKYAAGWSPRLGKSNSHIAKFNQTEGTCFHCGKTGRGGGFHRWHLENCREAKCQPSAS